MIRLTNLADYAVVVMVQAAQGTDNPVNAATIAEAAHLPQPTVAKVMGALARAGLLVSHRGIGGGYQLAMRADRITVADIVEALDGPIALTQCVTSVREDGCELESVCAMRGPWQVINSTVRDALASVSLEELARPVFPFHARTNTLAHDAVAHLE
jgi:FeS assembly SUF system regulator